MGFNSGFKGLKLRIQNLIQLPRSKISSLLGINPQSFNPLPLASLTKLSS